jgi:hypothetical protein
MPVIHHSRTGKTYYLHTGPKRGGGAQHFFSTKAAGSLAERVPDGFEIYETVNGQVYLRRAQARRIRDEELAELQRGLAKPRAGHRYKVEARGNTVTIHESENRLSDVLGLMPSWGLRRDEALEERFAYYQPVLRFILTDAERRLFAPERYCFRGSVEDWISIGTPDTIAKLVARYLKHLGQDSFYELY